MFAVYGEQPAGSCYEQIEIFGHNIQAGSTGMLAAMRLLRIMIDHRGNDFRT